MTWDAERHPFLVKERGVKMGEHRKVMEGLQIKIGRKFLYQKKNFISG